MSLVNAVVVDLSPHPEVSYAVIVRGQLLPIRFARESEAVEHLGQMQAAEHAPAAHPYEDAFLRAAGGR